MAKLPPWSAVVLAVVIIVATTAFRFCSAVDYQVVNDAVGTPGGDLFNTVVGESYAKMVLTKARPFIFSTLGLPEDGNRRDLEKITCVIDKNAASKAVGSTIHISAGYIERISRDVPDLRLEMAGMLYQLQTQIWQPTGKGQAPVGLLNGVSYYVQYKAGLEPLDGRWVKPGQGKRWDEGYDVTARFLIRCEELQPGFVRRLNTLMQKGYSDDFFRQLLGKRPAQLFSDYKSKFGR